MKNFVDAALSAVNRKWRKTGVLRVPDVEMASGKKVEKIGFQEADFLAKVPYEKIEM